MGEFSKLNLATPSIEGEAIKPPLSANSDGISDLDAKIRPCLNIRGPVDVKLWNGGSAFTNYQGTHEKSLSFRAQIIDIRPFEDTLLVKMLTGSGTGPWGSGECWVDSKILHSINGEPLRPK